MNASIVSLGWIAMSEEREFQLGFWVKGLLLPDEKIAFGDSLLIQGIADKEASRVFSKSRERKAKILARNPGKSKRKSWQTCSRRTV